MIKLNGLEIKPTIFPDGTSQIWKIKIDSNLDNQLIEWEFQHEGELMHVAQLLWLLNSKYIYIK